MPYIHREITNQIQKLFFEGKAIILLGARQIGKTTLINKILNNFSTKKIERINGDDPDDIDLIANKGLDYYEGLFDNVDIIFIDEAQKIPNIGNTIKLLVDHYKRRKQVVITGSSSINITENTSESLTGRKYTFDLHGISAKELTEHQSRKNLSKNIESILLYGTYPEILVSKSFDKKEFLLDQITDSNLYKDILELNDVRNPMALRQLLKLVALQIGQEVSTQELANSLGIDKNTVDRYLDLLERAYLVFRLTAFSKNRRKEIVKNKKIFFYDLGIRNAIINDFRDFSLRNDVGSLWENFVILERLKRNRYSRKKAELHFWRTYAGQEIDLVENTGTGVKGYEIKNNSKVPSKPSNWEYGEYKVINRDNYLKYIL